MTNLFLVSENQFTHWDDSIDTHIVFYMALNVGTWVSNERSLWVIAFMEKNKIELPLSHFFVLYCLYLPYEIAK